MAQEVMISVKGIQQFDAADKDSIELVTRGSLARDGGMLTLQYEESELTGLEGTLTTIQVEPERVTMLRTGQVNTQMVFQEGIPHESLYQMPFGALMITVKATSVFFDIVPDGGVIDLMYDIEIENTQAGVLDYHLDIRAK